MPSPPGQRIILEAQLVQEPLIPPDEQIRLATLKAYDILDTPAEQVFDEITAAAAEICRVPTALLCFVDRDRQWFKSAVGFGLKESSREVSFCAHALQQEDLFIVENALEDIRFADNPLVLGSPDIRFYAGMPLMTAEGQCLGTLCVIDAEPRELTPAQMDAVRALGRSAMRILDLRRRYASAVMAKAEDVSISGMTIADAGTPDLPLIFANRSFCTMTGYNYADVFGRPCLFLTDGISDAETVARISTCLASKQSTTAEVLLRTKSGKEIWSSLVLIPYLDSNSAMLYVACIYHDITALKEVEIQRQQLKAMRATMSTVNDTVLNFMNSLHWYRMQMEEEWTADPKILYEFDLIFQETLSKLDAINGLSVFKQKETGAGPALLDLHCQK